MAITEDNLTQWGNVTDLSNVSSGSSIDKAHHSLIALLALGHLQHLLHLTVHAALHLPACQYVACYLLLLHITHI